MKRKNDSTRRKFILGMLAFSSSRLANAALLTPPASEGPFYPTESMRYKDIDNDLVKIASQVRQAGGEVVRLRGRVLDQLGDPVEAARVEIWQCDVNGRYLHRADYNASTSDPAFQGFGHDITDKDGRYSFRTIKPVRYTGRTPHIHLKVWVDGTDQLTTQLYLPDHPDNGRDFLYRRIPEDKRELVTMRFEDTGEEPEARVDLVV